VILTPIPLLVLSLHALPISDGIVRGRCIEARTASVFAGACHYGAEATTGGREAVIAWRFESGFHRGIDLAGVEVAAAVVADANLAEPGSMRRSILYFSDATSAAARSAAGDLVRERFGSVLGTVTEERALPLCVRFDGDRYRVAGGELLNVEGALLADRACCKMPYQVWYRPFLPLAGAIVGCNTVFRYSDAKLGPTWERFDENTAFVGTFTISIEGADVSR
jgi:hypothetical protein